MEKVKLTLLENKTNLHISCTPMLNPIDEMNTHNGEKNLAERIDTSRLNSQVKHPKTEHEKPVEPILASERRSLTIVQNINAKKPELADAVSVPVSESGKTDEEPKIPIITKFITILIDNNYFLAFMTLCTLLALFLNDMQFAFCPIGVDIPFDTIQSILFFLFLFEILLTVCVKKDYLGSFFFWLDLISTISLLQDISWVFGLLLSGKE
jgi:hypothetical protein